MNKEKSKPSGGRTVINRSISWAPDVYEMMESRRGRLRMNRSEYINRLILADMSKNGDIVLSELPDRLLPPAPEPGKKRK
jgi:hypothetical protein